MPNNIVFLRDHISGEAGDGAKAEKRNVFSVDVMSTAGRKVESGNIVDLYKLAGEQSVTKLKKIMHQDFGTLKDICSKNKIYFEDIEFPRVGSSIGNIQFDDPIEWHRPKYIVGPGVEPKFFVDGPSRFDMKQGFLDDCWLIAAFANLAMNKDLLNQVVPEGQSFQDDYDGIFHFRFWQYGEWVDVVVDDYLPCTNSSTFGLELCFANSTADNEFWPALLEKAYAKLHGSYEALRGGNMTESMTDLTGGLSETYVAELQGPAISYECLLQAWEKKSLITCVFRLPPVPKDRNTEVYLKCVRGVVSEQLRLRHAYSITHVTQVTRVEDAVKVPLLRIRNPWGNTTEWLGAWSDGSKEWESISEEERKTLDLKSQGDGEFWMSFEDFKLYNKTVQICHLNLNQFSNSVEGKEWEISQFEGAWVRGATAGGCTCDFEMFHLNPQYRMTIEKESTVIVELMQKNRRTTKPDQGYRKIGIFIYSLKDNPSENFKQPLDSDFFSNAKAMDIDSFMSEKSSHEKRQFASNYRDVTYRLKLPPGVYCIIPSALRDDAEKEFLLRVFSDNPNTIEEYEQKIFVKAIENIEDVKDVKFLGIGAKQLSNISSYTGDDEVLDWEDCKVVLDYVILWGLYEGKKPVISERGCRSIVDMLNRYRSDVDEVETFWERIMILLKVFISYAKKEGDNGFISAKFLREALNKAGYFLDNHTLCELVRRSTAKDAAIDIDDFFIYAFEVEKKFKEESSQLTKLASPEEKNQTGVVPKIL